MKQEARILHLMPEKTDSVRLSPRASQLLNELALILGANRTQAAELAVIHTLGTVNRDMGLWPTVRPSGKPPEGHNATQEVG